MALTPIRSGRGEDLGYRSGAPQEQWPRGVASKRRDPNVHASNDLEIRNAVSCHPGLYGDAVKLTLSWLVPETVTLFVAGENVSVPMYGHTVKVPFPISAM